MGYLPRQRQRPKFTFQALLFCLIAHSACICPTSRWYSNAVGVGESRGLALRPGGARRRCAFASGRDHAIKVRLRGGSDVDTQSDGSHVEEGPALCDFGADECVRALGQGPGEFPDVRATLQEVAYNLIGMLCALQHCVNVLNFSLAQVAKEEGLVLPCLPKHFGVPKTAAEVAASIDANEASLHENLQDEGVCEEDWPRDPLSGERRFGEWFYQDVPGVEDPGPPVPIPNAADAHLLDPRDLEDGGLSQEEINERLLYAALTSQHDWIDTLVGMGAQVNLACDLACGKATALHCSAVTDDEATVGALLRNGADVRVLNALRQSALHLAAYYGHTRVLMVLYRRGALHPPPTTSRCPSATTSSSSSRSSSSSTPPPGGGRGGGAGRKKVKGGGGGRGDHREARALLQLKDIYGYTALDYAQVKGGILDTCRCICNDTCRCIIVKGGILDTCRCVIV